MATVLSRRRFWTLAAAAMVLVLVTIGSGWAAPADNGTTGPHRVWLPVVRSPSLEVMYPECPFRGVPVEPIDGATLEMNTEVSFYWTYFTDSDTYGYNHGWPTGGEIHFYESKCTGEPFFVTGARGTWVRLTLSANGGFSSETVCWRIQPYCGGGRGPQLGALSEPSYFTIGD
jgi:hypothetical protein